jgi:hypothetical protein
MANECITAQEENDNFINSEINLPKYYNFDIDCGKGNDIVEEVNYLMHNFVYGNENPEITKKGLLAFYFSPEQADQIMRYFKNRNPGDMYDIERGLNNLRIKLPGQDENENPKIVIKNALDTPDNKNIPVKTPTKTKSEAGKRHFEVSSWER